MRLSMKLLLINSTSKVTHLFCVCLGGDVLDLQKICVKILLKRDKLLEKRQVKNMEMCVGLI
jgi:hypothetical protein